MNKIVKYVLVAVYVSLVTIFAMVAYSQGALAVGVVLEVILLITIFPLPYLLNYKSDFDHDNAYLSFPYHLITYLCNVLLSLGFYFWGNVDNHMVVWKTLLWFPFVLFHAAGYVIDYRKRYQNVKFD